jgi:hypothetical protein
MALCPPVLEHKESAMIIFRWIPGRKLLLALIEATALEAPVANFGPDCHEPSRLPRVDHPHGTRTPRAKHVLF